MISFFLFPHPTAALDAAGLDWAAPTLLVAECVLVYMPAEASQRLVQWAAACFGPPHSPGAALVSYDMILPHDAFGRVMRANLKVRASQLTVWGWEGDGVDEPEPLIMFDLLSTRHSNGNRRAAWSCRASRPGVGIWARSCSGLSTLAATKMTVGRRRRLAAAWAGNGPWAGT